MLSVLNGLAGIYREKTDPRRLQCWSSLTLCHLPGHWPAPPTPNLPWLGPSQTLSLYPRALLPSASMLIPAGGGGPSHPAPTCWGCWLSAQ